MFTFVVHNYFNIELQKELIGQIMNLCLKSGIFFILKTVGENTHRDMVGCNVHCISVISD